MDTRHHTVSAVSLNSTSYTINPHRYVWLPLAPIVTHSESFKLSRLSSNQGHIHLRSWRDLLCFTGCLAWEKAPFLIPSSMNPQNYTRVTRYPQSRRRERTQETYPVTMRSASVAIMKYISAINGNPNIWLNSDLSFHHRIDSLELLRIVKFMDFAVISTAASGSESQ